MSESKEVILQGLFDAVVAGDVQKARKLAEQTVTDGISANVAIEKMMEAMRAVDAKYFRKEYFTLDVAAASTAMREAFRILEPHLRVQPVNTVGKIVIGSLKGNIQGLGKDIVAAALRSAGFEVVDLGVNVSPESFVASAEREKAQVIAVSVSVDETVPFLKDLVGTLSQKKRSHKLKTIVGGRAVSERIRLEYGIDAYAKDAWDCVKKVKELLSH